MNIHSLKLTMFTEFQTIPASRFEANHIYRVPDILAWRLGSQAAEGYSTRGHYTDGHLFTLLKNGEKSNERASLLRNATGPDSSSLLSMASASSPFNVLSSSRSFCLKKKEKITLDKRQMTNSNNAQSASTLSLLVAVDITAGDMQWTEMQQLMFIFIISCSYHKTTECYIKLFFGISL